MWADRWTSKLDSQVSHQRELRAITHQRRWPVQLISADVRTCVTAEQREGTPLYQQYEDYVRAVRKSRWNDRRNPVLAGRALSILEACLSPKALLHRQTW